MNPEKRKEWPAHIRELEKPSAHGITLSRVDCAEAVAARRNARRFAQLLQGLFDAAGVI
jgi:hypothetical protein